MAHRVQQRPQRLSERSNGVCHSRGRVWVHGTFNNSGALQIAEYLGERSLCDSGNSALQFGKSFGTLKKLLENGGFPSSTDDACGGFYRTEFWRLGHDRLGFTLYTLYSMRVKYSHVTTHGPSSSILTMAIAVLDF